MQLSKQEQQMLLTLPGMQIFRTLAFDVYKKGNKPIQKTVAPIVIRGVPYSTEDVREARVLKRTKGVKGRRISLGDAEITIDELLANWVPLDPTINLGDKGWSHDVVVPVVRRGATSYVKQPTNVPREKVKACFVPDTSKSFTKEAANHWYVRDADEEALLTPEEFDSLYAFSKLSLERAKSAMQNNQSAVQDIVNTHRLGVPTFTSSGRSVSAPNTISSRGAATGASVGRSSSAYLRLEAINMEKARFVLRDTNTNKLVIASMGEQFERLVSQGKIIGVTPDNSAQVVTELPTEAVFTAQLKK